MLLQYLSIAVSLGSLVCYVMVVIQMFQHGKTGPRTLSASAELAIDFDENFRIEQRAVPDPSRAIDAIAIA